MNHLLLSRLQGALIGGNTIYISSYQITPNRLMIDTTPALTSGITSLIYYDRFVAQDWAKNTTIDISSPDRFSQGEASPTIVAMLPLMLFFHDDRIKLREILIEVSHAWQLDWETCSSAIAIGYIISRSLTESFNPETIISQLLDEMNNLHPLLFQSLSTIAQLLEQPSSLHQINQRLTTTHPIITPTILAIYCALSTPEDFSLSTRRAYHTKNRSPLTCALTGILAGAQNSLTGIPLNGYLATQDRVEWLSAAENLLNAWAGVYHNYSSQSTAAYPLSVASPRVMQRRN
jgi:ADP-ribosylglycohydrolase